MIRKALLAAVTATVTASLLTACGTTEPTTPSPTAIAAPAAASTGKADLTRSAFSLTWAGVSETERTNLCNGLLLLGPDRAAEEMGIGADHSQDLDWDLMVDLLIAECDAR